MERKFFCETCKMSIPYTRTAIQDHQRSQRHRQNHEKEIERQHLKSKLDKLSNYEKYLHHQQKQQETSKDEEFLQSDSMMDYIKGNISGIKKFNDLHKKNKLQDAPSELDFSDEERNKRRAQRFQQMMQQQGGGGDIVSQAFSNVWSLERDDLTKKLCFFNRISYEKVFDKKPFGLKLSDEDQKLWDNRMNEPVQDTKETLEQNDINGPVPTYQSVKVDIGEWEEVEVQDDFYNKYAAKDSDEEYEQDDQMNEFQQLEENLEDKTDFINDLIELEVKQNKTGVTKNRAKNDLLQKLATNDVEINAGVKPMYKNRSNDPLYLCKKDNKESIQQDCQIKDAIFKKRILNDKKTKKIIFDENE